MRENSQHIRPSSIPSIEGIRAKGFNKKKINSQKVEVATNREILEVKIGKDVKTRLIKTVEFEERRWPYIMALPLMWVLTIYVMAKKAVYKLLGIPGPKINALLFDGLGLSCRKIKEGAVGWRALDIIYNYRFGSKINYHSIIDDFWIGMMNAQAVRNRLKLVKQEIRSAISHFSNYEEVRLLSLAAGSAQGVIEVMAEFKAKGIKVRTILVDIDQSAFNYANRLAFKNGVFDQVKTIKTSVSQVARISRYFKPQVIEMIGLLDYIPQDKAIRLIRRIYESLGTKGIFLTGNIASNLERRFLNWVINWDMIYRAPEELAEIVSEAGFSDFRLVYEPLKIHGLLIAQKE